MAFIISKERAQVLNKLLSFEMDETERYFLRTAQDIYAELADFAEMHYFVSNFSWAKDQTILQLIANDERCDKATALMIFWRACPRSYTVYTNEEEAKVDYGGFIFSMLKDILAKWEGGFYTHQQIAYNPYKEDASEVNNVMPNEKWAIPESIKVALPGDVVMVEK